MLKANFLGASNIINRARPLSTLMSFFHFCQFLANMEFYLELDNIVALNVYNMPTKTISAVGCALNTGNAAPHKQNYYRYCNTDNL